MPRSPFLRKLRKYFAAIPALAFGFVASPAFSATVVIDANGVTTGTSSASFLGATLTSTGGSFSKSTTPGINPNTVIGVNAGYIGTEVDVSGERLSLTFGSTGAIVNQITVGMLFLSSAGGDTYNEAVQLLTNGGSTCATSSTVYCILSASGFYRGALVQNISPATAGNGGIFRITNPFGSELISTLDLVPWAIGTPGAANSDFGLVSITYTTTAIPEPGTIVLAGLGLLGLAFASGRRARG